MGRLAKAIILIALLAGIVVMPSISYALPAFPGAEGWGADTPGGRGGEVIEVTTLEDYLSGWPYNDTPIPGSLRYALEEIAGPRIIIFRVGGTIELKKKLLISGPYLTIAGQTAPGGGITLKAPQDFIGQKFVNISGNDVVVRYIRFRAGDKPLNPGNNWDALQVNGHNIVIDHCSMSWSLDEVMQTWGINDNITFSWNIFSEAMGSHPYGPIVSSSTGYGGYPDSISMHHNLFVHISRRNPALGGIVPEEWDGEQYSHFDIRNNLVYNFRGAGSEVYNYAKVNYIANYLKRGPDTEGHTVRGLTIDDSYSLKAKVYLENNRDTLYRPDDSFDELEICGRTGGGTKAEPEVLLSSPIDSPAVTTHTPEQAYNLVLKHAGVTVPKRDAVDERVINDVKNGTGAIIVSQDDVGGWPLLEPGTAPQDSDHDGMPDEWELAHGLNPNNYQDCKLDRDGDGYTNIEEYINGLVVPVQPPALPGDFDGDGDVDLQDLLIVAKGYGVTYDLQDLLLVAMHYGEKL